MTNIHNSSNHSHSHNITNDVCNYDRMTWRMALVVLCYVFEFKIRISWLERITRATTTNQLLAIARLLLLLLLLLPLPLPPSPQHRGIMQITFASFIRRHKFRKTSFVFFLFVCFSLLLVLVCICVWMWWCFVGHPRFASNYSSILFYHSFRIYTEN